MASPSISCPSSGIFWTLYGLQNDYATPLVPALCPMETITWVSASLLAFLKVRPVCSLQGGTGLWENEPALWDWSMASRFLSLPHFPQAAWRMLPCSGCTQSARGTPGGWWFPDHSKGCFVAPSEQSNMSLPCTAVLHTKSQTAGKKATSTKTSSFPFWMKKKKQLAVSRATPKAAGWWQIEQRTVWLHRDTVQRAAFPAEGAEQAKLTVPELNPSAPRAAQRLLPVHGITISADHLHPTHPSPQADL